MTRTFAFTLVALALCGAIAAGLAEAKTSLDDPNPYLKRHGLEAPLVPFHVVPKGEVEGTPIADMGAIDSKISNTAGASVPIASCLYDGTAPNEDCPAGGSYQLPGVWIREDLGPLWKARVALHEWLHVVSHYHSWCLIDGNLPGNERYLQRPFVRWYEEGLVEANTLHLLPGYWRDLTGRKIGWAALSALRWTPTYPEAFRWLRAAEQATGTPRWSRANREWLIERLTDTLDERVAYLNS